MIAITPLRRLSAAFTSCSLAIALTAALSLTVLTAGGTPGAAADSPPAGRPAAGTEVRGGSSVDDAAAIEPGSYADDIDYEDVEIGQSRTPQTYRITLDDGELGYVSASLITPLDQENDSIGAAALELTIASPADSSCEISATGRVASGDPGPVMVSANTGVLDGNNPNDSCFQRGNSFIVSVVWNETYEELPAQLPLELQFVRQTPAAWSQLPVPVEDPPAAEFLPESLEETEALTGGTTVNAATRFRDPAADVEVRTGVRHFYRVPVEAGQQLSVRARTSGPADHRLTLAVLDPNLRPVAIRRPGEEGAPSSDMADASGSDGEASIGIDDAGATTALTTRYPVNPRNAFVSFEEAHSSSIAGDYYIAVLIEPPFGGEPDTGTQRVRLSWETTGETLEAAPEVEGAGAVPELFGMEAGSLVRVGGLGLGAVFLGIAGLLAVLAVRRSRR